MNAGICAVLLRQFIKPYVDQFSEFDTGEEKFEMCRNLALDENNAEITKILAWIEQSDLVETFFQ